MTKQLIIHFIIGLNIISVVAQKRAIEAQDYKTWRSISSSSISNDGTLIGYETKPLEGDPTMYIRRELPNSKQFVLDSFERGTDIYFNKKSTLSVFRIVPGYDTIRSLKLKKVKNSKWPKDSLCIIDNKEKTIVKVPKLKKFHLSAKGNTFCYLYQRSTKKGSPWHLFSKHKPQKHENVLRVYTKYPEILLEIEGVSDFILSENGMRLAILKKAKSEKSFSVFIFDLRSKNPVREFDAAQKFKLSAWSESGDKFAFFQNQDSSLENYELHVYDLSKNKSTVIGASFIENAGFKDSLPSIHQTPKFSKNGRFLVLGMSKRLTEEPKDSILESEKAHVDVWHYLDLKIQPQQLKEVKREKKKSNWFVYNFDALELNRLNNDTLALSFKEDFENRYHLARSYEAYAISSQWSYPWSRDLYRLDIETQKKDLVATNVLFGGALSPNGEVYTYFDPIQSQHMALNIELQDTICLTCGIDSIKWARDKNGLPALAGPEQIYGFSRDMCYYFQSRRDIWFYDFKTNSLQCLTSYEGKSRNIKLSLRKKESDSLYVDLENAYISGFNKVNKGLHIFELRLHEGHYDLIENLVSPHKLLSLDWANEADKVLIRRSTVNEYPDLYLGDSEFKDLERISDVNPQQKDLKWSTVELVSWKSYDSVQLEGLVYLPEDYDNAKRYPMLVYYYELNADNLHRYRSPRPSASIINPVECASNDYIVFVPDIRYRTGYPARSAYDAVMSGTDFMLKNYAVDSLKMGLQGQSWGGYQTAQLITMTERYAAAMAGAPVSNMFSAYGGIRWGSGLNRQFQYEATQSRIGQTIWEAPELYYENSPIFHLPKVTTPLLIMHNDADGAVPWYQGIEMYNGMRRLGKPCWMLVYNKDGHNLKKLPNKYDLSKRMGQFFDHYLKSAPMPIWMSSGIRAIDKGEKNGYGYEEE